jgi:hypothetical protein
MILSTLGPSSLGVDVDATGREGDVRVGCLATDSGRTCAWITGVGSAAVDAGGDFTRDVPAGICD